MSLTVELLPIWAAAVMGHAALVFGLVGSNTTGWTTFGGLVVIDTVIYFAGRRPV